MKQFLSRSIAFCLLLVVLFIGLEYVLTQFNYPFNNKRDHFFSHLENHEVLVMGSSQNHCLINPSDYPKIKIANLAQGGQTWWVDRLLLEEYLRPMSSMKALVLECSYHNLEETFIAESLKSNQYLRFYGINTFQRAVRPLDYSLLLSKGKDEYLKMIDPFAQRLYSNEFGAVEDLESIDASVHRFLNWDYDKTKISEGRKDQLVQRYNYRNLDVIKSNQSEFESMISLALDNNLKVLIVRPPLYETFLMERLPEKVRQMDEFIQEVQRKYGAVQLVDLNQELNLDVTEFINEDHVNYKGAQEASSVLQPILETMQPD